MNEAERSKKRRLREQNELLRLKAERSKARYAGYFIVLLVMIVLTDVLDNLATNIGANITSSFITEFFVNGKVFGKSYEYEAGLALHNTISLIGYVISFLVSFYKSLADRIGRKPLFVLSALGMAAGLLIIFCCRSYFVFLIGSFMLSFFIGSDIQILYVLEEAPKEKRATVYSLLKGLGGLSSVAIPTMRATLMSNDPTKWRNVYLLPGLFGLAVAALIVLLVKETRIFQDRRIEQLEEILPELPDTPADATVPVESTAAALLHAEAPAAADETVPIRLEPQKTQVKAGVISAIKYIFKRKDLRTLILIKILFDAAIVAMTNYESIMYRAEMSTESITTAEFFYPFIYCAAVIVSGFLADKIGRKKTVLLFGLICAASFVWFIVSANSHFSPALVGIGYGLYLGGYWIGRDYMAIISTEMVPTGIRASIMGAEGLLVYIGMAVGFAFVNVGMLFAPLWLVCGLFALPCILISVFLLSRKVKETMGVDYEAITGEGV
ncbi:MAG: MFS transporter [Lachnospiraceae bacterium]|nr:MFS transporter [Lachnospiraceae bacterium]